MGTRADIWVADLDGAGAALRGASALLDPQERERAAAFVRPADRERYVAAHAGLRRVLGAELGIAPERVAFRRRPCHACGEPHGKPVLAGDGPCFSMAHAGRRVLYALADREVGADVERSDPGEIEGCLHPDERRGLAGLPAPARARAAAACWTRKEAYLKGTGAGLNTPPWTVRTGLGDAWGQPAEIAGWTLHDLDVGPGYAAAVALQGATSAPRVREVAA